MLFEGWREIFEEAIGPINFVDTCFVVPGKRGVVFCSVNRKEREVGEILLRRTRVCREPRRVLE